MTWITGVVTYVTTDVQYVTCVMKGRTRPVNSSIGAVMMGTWPVPFATYEMEKSTAEVMPGTGRTRYLFRKIPEART